MLEYIKQEHGYADHVNHGKDLGFFSKNYGKLLKGLICGVIYSGLY